MGIAAYIYLIGCFFLAAGLSWPLFKPPVLWHSGLASFGAWLQFFVVLYLVLNHAAPAG